MGIEDFTWLFILSLGAAAISFTITTTSIFKWLRDIVSGWGAKADELIHCPWCLGHYISLVILVYFGLGELHNWDDVLGFIMSWFAMMGMVGLIHFVLLRAYEPVAKTTLKRKLEEVNRENPGE
jgi:hypothetical protein